MRVQRIDTENYMAWQDGRAFWLRHMGGYWCVSEPKDTQPDGVVFPVRVGEVPTKKEALALVRAALKRCGIQVATGRAVRVVAPSA